MERQRQCQHVAEIPAHELMRWRCASRSVLQGHDDVADDAADADGDPDAEQT